MKKDKIFDWQSLETRLSAGLQQEQNSFQLKDTPFYPLAFHAEMPENSEYENGHISFRFKDFTLSALNSLTLNTDACRHTGNELSIALRLNDAALKARYEINTKYASRITLDTGGNMRDLDATACGEGGADNNGVAPLSQDEIDAMVTQARSHRDSIQETMHGPTLMSAYNEHSESYNSAFVTSERLRKLWAQGGITTQMSRDTHDSLNNNTVVNSATTLYSNKRTYNQNAASQQVNVAFALTIMESQARNDGNTALADKYKAAANAAASFQSTVNQTGDDKKQPANMTGSQVYDTLNNPMMQLVSVSDEQFNNMIDQANDADSKDGGADAVAIENGWRILDADERKMIRERMFLFQEELTAIKGIQPELLWAGDCQADLKGMEATITVTYDTQTAAWTVSHSEVTLPGFYMEVDDATWHGKTANIVRERLANIHFVKSLLQSKIQSGIQSILEKVIVQSL
ncbi:hypothetical protein FAM09_16790 [Niastella caeni]|uniref:Uncharacterized protein n=1 Tax=Niastella caeni TaxID=2569763 RepID=A0A4S8HYL5_9BACT|nr:hypothetical protein [Niastella caeni]THU38332.1 hypothetical protein FAM09_16790 [Niastella caeni]